MQAYHFESAHTLVMENHMGNYMSLIASTGQWLQTQC